MKRAALAAAIIASVVSLLMGVLPLQSLEGWLIDWRYVTRARMRPVEPASPIRVVLLDSKTEKMFAAEPRVFWLPHLTRAASAMIDAGARAVGFDIIPQYPVNEESFRYRELMQDFVILAGDLAFEETPPLVMGVHLEVSEEGLRAIKPSLPILTALGEENLGLVVATPDPDGVVRRQVLTPSNFGVESLAVYPYLSGLLAERATGKAVSGQVQVNFAGTLDQILKGQAFPTYSLADVLSWSPEELKSRFADSVVLVGTGSVADLDIVTSPFSRVRQHRGGMQSQTTTGMLGVLYQAHVLHTIMTDSSLGTVPGGARVMLWWACLFCFALAVYTQSTARGLAVGLVLLGLGLGAGWILFVYGDRIIALAPLVVGWVFTFGLAYLARFWFEERQRQVVQDLFGRYVARDVMEQLLAEPSKASLGATEEREVTVFFSDINGFSTISEKYTPAQVMDMVNDYFREMTAILFRTRGTIKQFVGDEIMAVYGAPKEHETAAESAVEAALDMVERLAEIEKGTDKPGFYSVKCGIHTGQVIAGNVGSEERKEWAVVGDDVNLASRIMSLTKGLNCEILISETTYEKVKDKVKAEFIDHGIQGVKGREGGVRVYEVKRS